MNAPTASAVTESVTGMLAERLVELSQPGAASMVSTHARGHIANALALGIAASASPAVEAVVRLGRELGGAPAIPLPGRLDKLDLTHAALAMGVAAHMDDFDDTHLATVIHPSAATLAAVWPLSIALGASGERAVTAFSLGCEAQLRIGLAMSPDHYDAGWHITGTCGVLGAAVAAGILLKLESSALSRAIGIAASCTVGQREGFGTMLKALHPGKAAANGVLAARLAAAGFTGSQRVLEAPRGLFAVLADRVDMEQVNADLGERWELADDVIKPYPCGVVIHPLIDAALQIHRRLLSAERIQEITVRCHPLVVDLTGVAEPADELQARFSAVHAVAAALTDGVADLSTFTNSRVTDPTVRRLRANVRLVPDLAVARDQCDIDLVLDDSTHLRADIAHASGSIARPLTNKEIAAKVHGLVNPTLPGGGERLMTAVNGLIDAPDLTNLIAAVVPEERS
jgi:2-methylcitrate dehydratase PrpD